MSELQHLAALLRWYREIGVDESVASAPIDLTDRAVHRPVGSVEQQGRKRKAPFAPDPEAQSGQAVAGNRRTETGRPTREPPPAAVPTARIAEAEAAAAAATSLAALEEAVKAYEGCALKATATHTVFCDGNPAAALMVVGEAPGAEEDRQGKPFVGPAGQLLDRMLAAIGLDRNTAYIANILFWRPPGNHQPSGAEIAACLPFTRRHIALAQPKVILMAGGTAAKALLDTPKGIMRLRGQWQDLIVPGLAAPVPAMATYHPAFLLRQPAMKRDAWRDLVQVKKRLVALSDS